MLRDARYRVEFTAPDTLYNILRSVNNGQTYDTVARNLRTLSGTSQDSNRIVDGVYINVRRLKPNLRGVIRDLTTTAGPDSIQSRFGGWQYTPSNNRNLRGAFRFRPGFYQSTQMSLVYPSQGFYTNVGSQVTAENLMPVQIEFTGDGNGQRAYRFRADTSQTLYDNFYIYDQMIDVSIQSI